MQGAAEDSAVEKLAENPSQDQSPALRSGQLLRSCSHPLQKGAGLLQSRLHPPRPRVQTGNRHGRLVAMARPPGHAVQQQGPRRDRLAMGVGDRQPRKERPPVVHQRSDARQHLTTQQVLGRESRPAPLVLPFVKVVLRVRLVTIVLREVLSS